MFDGSYESEAMGDKCASEGIVHGHIHNYDNMTYIHGHVHHSLDVNVDGCDLTKSADDVREPPARTISANQPPDSKEADTVNKKPDFRSFQIINFHQNKTLSGDSKEGAPGPEPRNAEDLEKLSWAQPYTDDRLLLQCRKRKLSNNTSDERCGCAPKVLELCCDMEHTFSKDAEKDKAGPEGEYAVKTEQETPQPNYRTTDNHYPQPPLVANDNNIDINLNQILSLDCDVRCQQDCKIQESESEDDENKDEDIFEKFCKECLDLGHEAKNGHDLSCNQSDHGATNHPHYHHHHHHHHHHNHQMFASSKSSFDTPLSTASSTSTEELLTSVPHKKQQDRSQPLLAPNTPMKNYSGHVVNNQIDLKILNDLCNISSLYEFPFANHMNHHNHIHEHKENESINLLESSINGKKTQPYDVNANISHSHHHHKVRLHNHMTNCNSVNPQNVFEHDKPGFGAQLNENTYSSERSTIGANGGRLEESTQVNPSVKVVDCFGFSQEPNTIAFNWAFKNEENAIKCEWDECPESYSNLIDLQKHMLRDHVAEEDATCNWLACAFEGEDTCSLIDHINTDHGINFGMNIAENNTMLDQAKHEKTQDYQVLKSEQSSLEDKTSLFPCKWGSCTEVFESPATLTAHLESVHLEKGKSEYHCQWYGCNRKFAQRQKLVRHLKVHSGYKPYKCEDCGKCFSSEDTLTQHKRTHSGEKPFECHICGKRFAVSSSLKIHIRTHTGEKPLQCKICGRRFSESSNLSKHMKSHQKKYSCVQCHRGFDTAEKLKVHQSRCSLKK